MRPMINVALPKGRLGEKAYAMLKKSGFDCPAMEDPGRKLIFENPEKGVRYFWVKPSDVAIYVERGAADLGIVGKDILLEYRPDVYELLDLGFGRCHLMMAVPAADRRENLHDYAHTRVATKFPHLAEKFFTGCGMQMEYIKMNGSIELGPIVGLSESIVDIVETGTTLRENNLVEIAHIMDASARLIANRGSFRLKFDRIHGLAEAMKAELAKRQK